MKLIDQEMFANEILQDHSDVLYVVDFFAEWCGPCKMLTPILEQVQLQYGDKVMIVKLDIDANQEITEELGIMSIPTVKIYRAGQLLQTVNGLQAPEFWTTTIDTLFATQ